jgi:DNA-directed RNA polymerase subunit RPC12/RpoP
MSEPEAAPAETLDHAESSTGKEHVFPCKQCGADLEFKPGAKDLSCPYCGHVQKIPQTAQEIREYCFNDYLGKPKKKGYGDQKGRDVRCTGCGSVTHFDPSLRATKCAFCGTPLITGDDDKAEDSDVIAPEAVLPFAVGKVQAQQSFKQWISSRWFAPSALKNENNLGQFQGVYRPFWTFDSHTVSHWTGERGDAYYVSESYTAMENGKSVTRTRQVRKIRWRYVSGVYREFFDDVLISAGQKTDFPTQYRLSGLKPFTPEFLSGFVAERYVVQVEQGWGNAKEVIADEIRSGIRGQIGGDEQRIHSCDTAYSGITYKHILLPLWLNTYKFGGKTFQFQVNGQTGDVQGTRPYSFWKIFFFVLFIAAVIGVVVLLANK